MIGIIEAPMIKQQVATKAVEPVRKEKDVIVMLRTDKIEIIIIDSLYFFLISTHTPKAAEPTKPPMIKTAPNIDASDYKILKY